MRILKFLLLSLCAAVAYAQPVVHIVVPFAAGGVQDIIARTIAPELGPLIGKTVVVENRAGAGGTIGNALVAKSAPDGNTLLLAAAGGGSATHLSMAYFASLTGIDMVHVPYKATNEAINEVLAGRADAVIASTIGALGFTMR